MANQATAERRSHIYRNLFKNQTLMLLWSGKSISVIGDAIFDVAVMWVIYAQSGSTFQSALIGVAAQLSSVIMSPVAGAVADRWDRKTIMWTTNLFSAIVVALVSVVFFTVGHLPLWIALASILILNGLTVFLGPAETSIMPAIVGKEQLTSAYGIFSTVVQSANLIGKGIAGVAIAAIGSSWALLGDSLTFIIVTICILLARIPKKEITLAAESNKSSMISDIKGGWKYMDKHPTLKTLIWLAFLVNITSFMGPLYPAFVETQLHGGATAYGIIQASTVIGAMFGGICTGFFDKRFKAGPLLGVSLLIASLATFGIAFSKMLLMAVFFQIIQTFFTSLSSVLIMSAQLVLVSDEYRGRIRGLMMSMAMLAMPISTLIAGGIGEVINISYLFAFAALWTLGIALFSLQNTKIRNLDTKS
ncbi:MFS transporter [Virgibacillus siamensis]|uniref:MFS transporter n=1 Tax=Virgibacillus siamensis TaxID=480071 RepID=UPI0009875385|nr:MFS transporter [Virgibacillus siamensis]